MASRRSDAVAKELLFKECKMKVIEYFNLEMVVDDKFKWIAYDEDGEINLFKNKPIVVEGSGYWIDNNDCAIHPLGNRISFIDAKDWKLSLREI